VGKVTPLIIRRGQTNLKDRSNNYEESGLSKKKRDWGGEKKKLGKFSDRSGTSLSRKSLMLNLV